MPAGQCRSCRNPLWAHGSSDAPMTVCPPKDLMAALEDSLARAKAALEGSDADRAELEAIVGMNAYSYDHGWGTRTPAERREIIDGLRGAHDDTGGRP